MYIYPGLCQIVLHDAVECGFQRGCLLFGQRRLQVFAYVPLRKQAHFAHQHVFVVQRQNVFLTGQLNFNQRIACITIKYARIFCVESLQVSGITQVAEQQKPLFQILSDDFRYVNTCLGKELGDVDEWTTIFMLRRGVHHHQRAFSKCGTKIAAEAGIGRCGRK